MTETRGAHITRALQDINTWRASGMKLKAYAQFLRFLYAPGPHLYPIFTPKKISSSHRL